MVTSHPPKKAWVPDRQDIIWIGCTPQTGREMRDMTAAGGRKARAASYARSHQPKSFDWRARRPPYPVRQVSPEVFTELRLVLNQILQLA